MQRKKLSARYKAQPRAKEYSTRRKPWASSLVGTTELLVHITRRDYIREGHNSQLSGRAPRSRLQPKATASRPFEKPMNVPSIQNFKRL